MIISRDTYLIYQYEFKTGGVFDPDPPTIRTFTRGVFFTLYPYRKANFAGSDPVATWKIKKFHEWI